MGENTRPHSREPVYSSIQYTEDLERELETITDTLCFRVPIKYKLIYKKMPYLKKKRLRELIPALIEAMEKGEIKQSGQTVININMNINEVSANARAENKVKVVKQEDVQAVRALIDDMLRLLSSYLPQQSLWVLRRRVATVEKVLDRLQEVN